MNFESDATKFVIEVSARPNGISASAANATITIYVLNVPEPPYFNDSFIRNVFDNQTAGVPLSPGVQGGCCDLADMLCCSLWFLSRGAIHASASCWKHPARHFWQYLRLLVAEVCSGEESSCIL